MSDAPERILARVDYDGEIDGQWIDADAPKPHSFGHYFDEFVREDVAEAEKASLRAKLAKVLADLIEKYEEIVTQPDAGRSLEDSALVQARDVLQEIE